SWCRKSGRDSTYLDIRAAPAPRCYGYSHPPTGLPASGRSCAAPPSAPDRDSHRHAPTGPPTKRRSTRPFAAAEGYRYPACVHRGGEAYPIPAESDWPRPPARKRSLPKRRGDRSRVAAGIGAWRECAERGGKILLARRGPMPGPDLETTRVRGQLQATPSPAKPPFGSRRNPILQPSFSDCATVHSMAHRGRSAGMRGPDHPTVATVAPVRASLPPVSRGGASLRLATTRTEHGALRTTLLTILPINGVRAMSSPRLPTRTRSAPTR